MQTTASKRDAHCDGYSLRFAQHANHSLSGFRGKFDGLFHPGFILLDDGALLKTRRGSQQFTHFLLEH